MKLSKPVFIIGFARSGTSILYRLLQNLPRYQPVRLDLSEVDIMRFSGRAHRLEASPDPALRSYLLDDMETYTEFIATIRPIRQLHRISDIRLSHALASRSNLWWRLTLNHWLLRSYFYYAQQTRKCQEIIEKTPGNYRFIERLRTAFPAGKHLYIYRHPIDVYTSYIRRGRIDKPGWAKLTIGRFCDNYRRQMNAVQTHQQRAPESLMGVRYEKLVTGPAETCREIGRFLDCPCDYNTLANTECDFDYTPDPFLTKGLESTTKEWREFVSQAETDEIQERLSDVMDAVNYSRYSY